MNWCEALTSRQKPPAWRGPAQVHLKLSAGDEGPDEAPLAPQEDERFCNGCETAFPATTEHFYAHKVKGRRYLYNKCKECMKAEERGRSAQRQRGAA